MIDERIEELASLYALDLLEGAELAAFEAQLRADPTLQSLVGELRESAAALAFTAPAAAPSPALKQRLLEQIGGAASAADTSNVVPFSFTAWASLAAAACFAVVTVFLAQKLFSSREEASALRTEIALTDIARRNAENQLKAERLILNQQITQTSQQLAEARQQLTTANGQLASTVEQLAASTQRVAALDQHLDALNQQLKSQGDLAQFKIAALTSMLKDSPEAVAVALWNPTTQSGVLSVAKLPALAADKDYQLWVVDPAYPIPVDGGVFTVDPATGEARVNFHPDKPVKAAAKFAISLERKGGVPKAEGPIVLFTK